jgi:hypothetical protein
MLQVTAWKSVGDRADASCLFEYIDEWAGERSREYVGD